MKVHPREKMVEGKSNVSKKTLRCLQFSRKERGRGFYQNDRDDKNDRKSILYQIPLVQLYYRR